MKHFLLISLFMLILSVYPAETDAITMPCSMVLRPTAINLKNAMGTALIYQVQLNPPSFKRTSLSIMALHLPAPSLYGNFDGYEGFAFKPNEISWRFKLYPMKDEHHSIWAGKFELITAEMENVHVQVRPSHSKSEKLGPGILSNHMNYCR